MMCGSKRRDTFENMIIVSRDMVKFTVKLEISVQEKYLSCLGIERNLRYCIFLQFRLTKECFLRESLPGQQGAYG